MNKIKTMTVGVSAAVLIAIGVTTAVLINQPKQPVGEQQQTHEVKTDEITFTAEKGKNVLEQLKAQVPVVTEDSAYGPYVTAVNGKKAEGGKFWSFYVNDQMAQKGAAEYITDGGEKITWETRITRNMAIAGALIVAGIALRLVPHAANFAPVGAIALFGGAILSPKIGWWLPLAIMILSDLVLGFHDTVLFTWAGFLLIGLFGMTLRDTRNMVRVPLGALGAAIIFYVVSNFGVWVAGGLYPHTLAGLADCYIAAIPFLKTSLLADVLFSTVLFSAYALAAKPATHTVSNAIRHY